jgi:hypothetical protein
MQRAGVQLRPPEGHEEHGIDFVSHGERCRILHIAAARVVFDCLLAAYVAMVQ